MTKEIIKTGEIVNKDGKKYVQVIISNEALSQINKIVLGDKLDADNIKQAKIRNQVHDDCLELFKEFN